MRILHIYPTHEAALNGFTSFKPVDQFWRKHLAPGLSIIGSESDHFFYGIRTVEQTRQLAGCIFDAVDWHYSEDVDPEVMQFISSLIRPSYSRKNNT